MMRLRLGVVAACLLALASAPAMAAIQSTVIGTGAPPTSLGGIPMTPFAADGRATGVTYTTVPAPIGGDLTFDEALTHATVGGLWATWSNGYTGDVYYTLGATNPDNVTITLPANTGAFYLYVEGNPAGTYSFTVTSGAATQTFNVGSSGGAIGVGFWDDAGGTLTSVAVSSSVDFAVGEFGIAGPLQPIPALGMMGLVILALALGLAGVWASRRLIA